MAKITFYDNDSVVVEPTSIVQSYMRPDGLHKENIWLLMQVFVRLRAEGLITHYCTYEDFLDVVFMRGDHADTSTDDLIFIDAFEAK